MAASEPGLQELKHRMKAVWTTGDFGKIAPLIQAEAEAFVGQLGLKPGMKVMDIGCGTGNQSIPAAREGAVVTGVDKCAYISGHPF